MAKNKISIRSFAALSAIAVLIPATVMADDGTMRRDSSRAHDSNMESKSYPNRDASTLPDNTGVNQRDRNASAKTPVDQSEKQQNVELTRRIRAAITERDNLSTSAQNVKVITDERGEVFLRGPVRSDQERQVINQIALSIAGENRVHNQLEVSR